MKMICVPHTPEAMKLLDTNNCPDSLLEIINLTTEEYDQLSKSGVIERINSSLHKIIDDYEDETINTIEELRTTLAILEEYTTPNHSAAINKLIKLNTLAIKKRTGLFFFF